MNLKRVISSSPSKAMSNDVFPDPVGPTMRLIAPRLKRSSSSILSVNVLLVPPGVNDPSFSFDQVKDESRNPITSGDTLGLGRTSSADSASDFVVNSSKSSVCRGLNNHDMCLRNMI